MIEPEMAFTHQEESLEVQEQYVAFLVQNVLESLRICIRCTRTRQRSLKNLYKIAIPSYYLR